MATAARAIREFRTDQDVWKVLDSWARETGYQLIEGAEGRGLYQKGIGLLVAPMKLEVRTTGDLVHLEAWVHVPFISRLMSLFILPDEITVESGDEGIRFLLVSGRPIEEPVAWYGPIVMNTQAELRTAMRELQLGTFIR